MPARKTTEQQEVELVNAYKVGVSAAVLAQRYGLSDTGVRNVLRRHGVVPCRANKALTRSQLSQMEILYQEGKTLREIASTLGVTHGVVSKRLRSDCGVGIRPSTKRKKLSVEQRQEIACQYKEGQTYAELSQEYGVSASVLQSALAEHEIKPRVGWSKYRTVCWQDRKGRRFIFKSTWEKAYAELLDREGADWQYEEVSYPLTRCRCYTPDFAVYEDGALVRLVEVHGWLDERTKRRLIEFVEMYPDLPFELLGPGEMADLGCIESSWSDHRQAHKVTALKRKLCSFVKPSVEVGFREGGF